MFIFLMGCLVLLAGGVSALENYPVDGEECSNCTNHGVVDPVIKLKLNGTDDSTDPDVTTTYTWDFYNITKDENGACTFDLENTWTMVNSTGTILTYDNYLHDPVIELLSPAVPGCYVAILTIAYNATKEIGGHTLVLTEEEACVDYACFMFCVNEYQCPNCSDIFCEYDCDAFPTESGEGTTCPNWTENGLCYNLDNVISEPGTAVVKWYIYPANDYAVGDTPTDSYLVCEDECWDARDTDEWCSETSNVRTYPGAPGSVTYEIVMGVWGDTPDGEDQLIFSCLVGSVVVVEEPVAAISEEF